MLSSLPRALPTILALSAVLACSSGDSDPAAGSAEAGLDAREDAAGGDAQDAGHDAQDAGHETQDAVVHDVPTDTNVVDQSTSDAADVFNETLDSPAEASDASAALTCFDDPPVGGPEPLPWPIYAGTCPTLATIPAGNTLSSSGADREFMLVLPSNLGPTARLAEVRTSTEPRA
jgi:hypothetical protein